MNLDPILAAIAAHAWWVLVWVAATAVINTVFHYTTPQDVDAWAEANPGVAKFAAFMRRTGFEPVALLTLLASFASTNPPPPGALGRKGDMPSVAPLPFPMPASAPLGAKRGEEAPTLASLAGKRGFIPTRVLFGLMLAACFPAAIGPAVPAASCTIATSEADYTKSLPFLEIVADCVRRCGLDYLAVIEALLTSPNPALAEAARMTKADPVKLEHARVYVEARLAAWKVGAP
jgi:hypothetical protein